MRVLLVNKFFYPRGGSETVFFQTRDLLQAHGHEVVDFASRGDADLPSPWSPHFAPRREYRERQTVPRRARDAAASIYSPAARRALAGLLDRVRPDVAHLHNVYHQLSLSIVDELAARRIPSVMTVHDSKIVCPSYNLFTNGERCRRCVTGSVLNAVRHKCVLDSRAASAVAAAEARLARTRGTYDRLDAVISPSRFLADLAATVVAPEKIHVVPNFVEPPAAGARARAADEPRYALFAGRLDALKGVRVLMQAFDDRPPPGLELRVAGTGPLEGELRSWAEGRSDVRVLGMCAREETDALMAGAEVLICPSVLEENCPMSVLEARAARVPVICSDRGGVTELVDDGVDGLVVNVDVPGELSAALRRLAADPGLRAEFSRRGLARLQDRHTAGHYYAGLMDAYEAAIHRAEAGR